jgi:hypothetical protein
MAVKAPFLPMDRLRKVAADFLSQYHSAGSIPVPIENIVEFDFHIDIVPTPGLHNYYDIDSYPSSDLKEFHVDDSIYRRQPRRYRFSLAHELSHLLIHQDIFSQLSFSSISEWKSVVCSIPPDEYSWIEWQAYSLAGLILVPCDHLKQVFADVSERAVAAGVVIATASPEARKIIESHVATRFDVNLPVIQRRTKADGLWPT